MFLFAGLRGKKKLVGPRFTSPLLACEHDAASMSRLPEVFSFPTSVFSSWSRRESRSEVRCAGTIRFWFSMLVISLMLIATIFGSEVGN